METTAIATKTFYITKEQFTTLVSTWADKKDHTARDHIIYNVLRGKPADLGFTERKSNIQGLDPWYAFNNALHDAKFLINWDVTISDNPAFNARVASRIANKKAKCKTMFGIDLPLDLREKLTGLAK